MGCSSVCRSADGSTWRCIVDRTHTSSPTELCWTMDFVHATLADRRPFQILTVVDHWSRCSPVLAAGLRMSGEAVSQVLDRVQDEGQSPRSITVDHETEFQPRALEDWASRGASSSTSSVPASPWIMPYMASLNWLLRNECLNTHQFASLA